MSLIPEPIDNIYNSILQEIEIIVIVDSVLNDIISKII